MHRLSWCRACIFNSNFSIAKQYIRPYCGDESDVWSAGVILYAILTGSLPFDDDNVATLYSKIRNGKYLLPKSLGDEAKDLISKMLEKDPHKRIKSIEILNHPWVKKGFPEYLAKTIYGRNEEVEEEVGEEEEHEINRDSFTKMLHQLNKNDPILISSSTVHYYIYQSQS